MEDKIEILFLTVQVVKAHDDKQQVWKLDDEYLELLADFLHISSIDRLCEKRFLDAGIDCTTKKPFVIGFASFYPLIRDD